MRYLPTFLGIWTIEIVPTLDNMVTKSIIYTGYNQKTASHVNR
jgi:hypothetical protein